MGLPPDPVIIRSGGEWAGGEWRSGERDYVREQAHVWNTVFRDFSPTFAYLELACFRCGCPLPDDLWDRYNMKCLCPFCNWTNSTLPPFTAGHIRGI